MSYSFLWLISGLMFSMVGVGLYKSDYQVAGIIFWGVAGIMLILGLPWLLSSLSKELINRN